MDPWAQSRGSCVGDPQPIDRVDHALPGGALAGGAPSVATRSILDRIDETLLGGDGPRPAFQAPTGASIDEPDVVDVEDPEVVARAG